MREWMKEARISCNLTMKEVSQKLDISESYYSLIERGERQKTIDIALASKLASIFGLTIEYIVSRENAVHPEKEEAYGERAS